MASIPDTMEGVETPQQNLEGPALVTQVTTQIMSEFFARMSLAFGQAVPGAGQANLYPQRTQETPASNKPMQPCACTQSATELQRLNKNVDEMNRLLRTTNGHRRPNDVHKPVPRAHAKINLGAEDRKIWGNKTPSEIVQAFHKAGAPWNKVTAANVKNKILHIYTDSHEHDLLLHNWQGPLPSIGFEIGMTKMLTTKYFIWVKDAFPTSGEVLPMNFCADLGAQNNVVIESARWTWSKLIIGLGRVEDAQHIRKQGYIRYNHAQFECR